MEHEAVAEAGVIGRPDPVAGEVVKAFVTLRPGYRADEALRRELIAFGRRRLASLAPKEIAFDQDLPHTRSRWEREFNRWVKALDDVPAPISNDPIDHLTVDCHWPEHDLVIELDTDQTHGTAWKRRDDAERDAYLKAKGKTVRRVRREDWDRAELAAWLRGMHSVRATDVGGAERA